MSIGYIPRRQLAHASPGAWVDQNLSGVVPLGTVGAIVRFVNTGGSTRVIAVRKNGSTDSAGVSLLRAGNHAQFNVGLDGSLIFESFIDSADVEVWLEGFWYDSAHVVFFDNMVSKTLTPNGTWQDIDISADTGSDTAIGVICQINHNDGSQISYGARKNGSSDAITTGAPQNQLSQFIVGCDEDEVFEAFFANVPVTVTLNIIGYFKDSSWINFYTTAENLSLSTTGSFQNIAGIFPATIIQVNSPSDVNLELRVRGETEDFYGDYQYGKGAIVVPGLVEGKIQTTDADFYAVAYIYGIYGATQPTVDVSYDCVPSTLANGGSGIDWTDPANILALDGANARVTLGEIAHVASVTANGVANTTSLTITIPESVEAGDILVAHFANRDATAMPTVTDDDTGGNTWASFAVTTTGASSWWKRATAGTAGKTITASGFTGSCAGGVSVYRGCLASGTPVTNVTEESNISGNETHASITPAYSGAMIGLAVFNRTGIFAVTSMAATSPSALDARFEHQNTGGSDCVVTVGSRIQLTAGATGSLTWAQTNAVTISHAYALQPASTSGAASKELQLTGIVPKAPGFRAMVEQNPDQFEVTGITVTLVRHAGTAATIRDTTIQRLDAGSAAGTNVADTSTDWDTVAGSVSYGGGDGVWGSLPTIEEILDGDFGLTIKVTNNGTLAAEARIDHVDVDIQISQPAAPPFREGRPPALENRALAPAPNAIADLVRRRNRGVTDLVWLAELSAVDPDTDAVETLTWCNGPSGGYRADTDADGTVDTQYDAVLSQPMQGTYRGFAPSAFGAESAPSRFTMVALNNGRYDYLRGRKLDGRTITTKVGAADLDYSDFRTVFTGIIARTAVTRDAVTIEFEDRRRLFDASLQPVRYSATYVIAELRNAVMPFGFGVGRNVEGHGIGTAQYRLMGDFPFGGITDTRGDAADISDPGTVDTTNGTATFASLPTTKITFDISGITDRNIADEGRDASGGTWTKTNCTAAVLTTGFDGTASRGFLLTASANNATCVPTLLETPNSPTQWAYAIVSVYARKSVGTGTFKLSSSSEEFTPTTDKRRYFVVIANPGATVGGITLVNSGDAVEFDFFTVTPGRYYPGPPIDTTGASAAVTNYPDTVAAVAKFLLTARSGLVPLVDFDEASFTLMAQKSAAKMGWYWTDDTTVMQALVPFLEGARAGIITDEFGRVVIKRVGLPEEAPVLVLHERNLFRESAVDQPLPLVGRVIVEHQPIFTIQSEEFASTLSAATRERYARPFIKAVAEDADILEEQGDTREATVTITTALNSTADAARLALSWLEILSQKRRPMSLVTGLHALIVKPFDVVRVSAPGLTYDRGDEREIVDMVVQTVTIDAAAERVTLGGLA